MDITDNVIFIPGATSGIGLALALALQAEGNEVIVGGRRVELLDRIATEHPELNVLIAMAGVMRAEDWTQPDGLLAGAEEIVDTNLLGPVRLIAAFIEHLMGRQDASIVTVSSGLAFTPLRATPTYNATKAAIHMLSESLRLQLADTGISVTELVPPAVATDLMPGQAQADWAMPLDEFVSEVVELIRAEPDAQEIQVERVKLLRLAEARGDYAQTVEALNSTVH